MLHGMHVAVCIEVKVVVVVEPATVVVDPATVDVEPASVFVTVATGQVASLPPFPK